MQVPDPILMDLLPSFAYLKEELEQSFAEVVLVEAAFHHQMVER
jgi:hypothetical protein